MIMKRQKYTLLNISVLFLLSVPAAYSQGGTWIKYGDTEALRAMNLEYRHPEGFTGSDTTECFDSHPDLRERFGCWSNKLHSDDGHFIAYFGFETCAEMINRDPAFRPDSASLDMLYVNYIRRDLHDIIGQDELYQWEKYVEYYPDGEAKAKFNADVAIIYPLKLSEPYGDKYSHCKGLVIQKNRRGFVKIQCFYDDVAAREFPEYLKVMEKIFRYGEKDPDLHAKYGIMQSSPADTLNFRMLVTLNAEGKQTLVPVLDAENADERLTGAWLQCMIADDKIHIIPGNLKVFRDDGTFSIYQSSTGKEWTRGTFDHVVPDSYVENLAGQTGSVFAGESVPIKYAFDKVNSMAVLKTQYYHRLAGRWVPEYYVKTSDEEAERRISKYRNELKYGENKITLPVDTVGVDNENLTGAWLQCMIVDNKIQSIPGNLKIFRDDGTFSIYLSNTGREWTRGTFDHVTSDSYIENLAAQTGSVFAGESVPIKYAVEKINSNIVLKTQYYHRLAGRWVPENYIKIPDTEAERIINTGKK
jgi:hypothetical protein